MHTKWCPRVRETQIICIPISKKNTYLFKKKFVQLHLQGDLPYECPVFHKWIAPNSSQNRIFSTFVDWIRRLLDYSMRPKTKIQNSVNELSSYIDYPSSPLILNNYLHRNWVFSGQNPAPISMCFAAMWWHAHFCRCPLGECHSNGFVVSNESGFGRPYATI